MKRTTARDERTPNIWKTVLAQQHATLDQMQRDLAYAGRFTDARKIDEIRREYDAGIPDEIRRRTMLMPFDRVRSRIIELRWTFLTTPHPHCSRATTPSATPSRKASDTTSPSSPFPGAPRSRSSPAPRKRQRSSLCPARSTTASHVRSQPIRSQHSTTSRSPAHTSTSTATRPTKTSREASAKTPLPAQDASLAPVSSGPQTTR
jgi:hypothetical protein